MIINFDIAIQGNTCSPALDLLRQHAEANNLHTMTWDEIISLWEDSNQPNYILWCLRNKSQFARITDYTITPEEAARDKLYIDNLVNPTIKHYVFEGVQYSTLEAAQQAVDARRPALIEEYKYKYKDLLVVNLEEFTETGDAVWSVIHDFDSFLNNLPSTHFAVQIFNPLTGFYTAITENMDEAKTEYEEITRQTVEHFEPNSFQIKPVFDYIITPEGKKVYYQENM